MEEFSRLSRLVGEEAMKKLAASRVAIFGIGGVGGYVAEALARSHGAALVRWSLLTTTPWRSPISIGRSLPSIPRWGNGRWT